MAADGFRFCINLAQIELWTSWHQESRKHERQSLMLHRFLVQLQPWVSPLAAHCCSCLVILSICLRASLVLVLHYKTLVVMHKNDEN
jgi:hypothetical protein